MRQEDVVRMLRAQPFVPFLIRLASGQVYEVRHPDLVLATRSTVIIGLPAADLPSAVAGDYVIVSLLHIDQLEPLAPIAPTNN